MADLDDSMDAVLATLDIPEEATSSNNTAVQIQQTESSGVQVNPKQKGNPLLKSITNIPWKFDENIVPDYVVGKNGKSSSD